MIKVETIQKVSQIGEVKDSLIIGVTSKELHGVMANNTSKILLYKNGHCIDKSNLNANKFISFGSGLLYYEKDGDPLSYFDFVEKKSNQITSRDFYVSPSQLRSNINSCVIIHMDKDFNQTFKLLADSFVARDLPQFPTILLNDSFIFFNRSIVKKYSISNFELKWKLEIDPLNQVERRNQGNAVFSDGVYVFTRLKGGSLICNSLESGSEIWRLHNEIAQVSFGEVEGYLYVHFGHGFKEVDKKTGVVTRSFLYESEKDLDSFSSNGIIWCFKEILVTRNSFTGDLAVFDRYSFSLIDRVIVDNSGIPESKDCVRFQDDYLYVLGASSTAYIYELN